jgi:Glycosyltransferase family 87
MNTASKPKKSTPSESPRTVDGRPFLALEAAFSSWRRWPLRHHVGALTLLTLVGLWRYWGFVTSTDDPVDEGFYVGAIEHVLAGESPYRHGGFFYPPSFALFSAWLVETIGLWPTLGGLRLLNLFGGTLTCWLALAFWQAGFFGRWVGAALLLIYAPGISLALVSGNLSLIIVGAILLALLLWQRRPFLAGTLLALSTALKPLAPPLFLLLTIFRTDDAAVRRRALLTVAFGGTILLTFFLMTPTALWLEFVRLGRDTVAMSRTISTTRVLQILNVPTNILVSAAIVLPLILWLARRRALDPFRFFCLATCAIVLMAPMLWNHSLLLTLPLQVAATQVARSRVSLAPDRVERRLRIYSLLLVLGAAASQHFCDGADGTTGGPFLLELAGFGLPLLAPIGLALYLDRHASAPRAEIWS